MSAGKTVSHYEILEKLGEGGMGVVYKALDLSLHRFVALKFLPPEITSTPDSIARFEAEARSISTLNHPNIATIHAMDGDGDRRFLVLEYLEGGTLRDRIRKFRAEDKPFPIWQAVSIGIQLASGLAHAHRRGVVHRDIKPENVMFTAEGTLRITDFGLAKPSGASEITRDGTTVGTAAYMGPEQAMGNETSPRGDLFSVGVVLYELVAGRRPFIGATEMAALHAMLSEQPPPVHLLRPAASRDLENIIFRLLDKDPAARYQTGEEVAADLEALKITGGLDDEVTGELNYSGPTRSLTRMAPVSSGQAKKPRRLVVAAVSAAMFLIAIVAGFAWMKLSRQSPAPRMQVAILPFEAASGSPEDAAFGNGLAAIVAGKLASLGADVVPDNDLRRNRVTTPADAQRVFGVTAVLTGKFDRQASGVPRLTLRMVDTGSGKTLRSATVLPGGPDRSLQDEVLKQSLTMLGISPDTGALNKLHAQDPRTANAYDLYVLGNGYLQRYDQPGNVGFAIASFQKAIRIDPSYAIAYAALGTAYLRQYQRFSHDRQDLDRAHDAALQAISRNETLASPHIILGAIAVAMGQVDEGIGQLRIALGRDPVNAEAYRELANAWVAAGKPGEAEATYKLSIRYHPGYWLGYADLGVFYNGRRRYKEAERALRTAITLTPDNYIVYRSLGGVQMLLGEWPDAERSFRKAVALQPQPAVYSNLGAFYIYRGRYADAIPVLEQAAALSGGDRRAWAIWGNLADAYRWTPSRRSDAAGAYRKAIEIAWAQVYGGADGSDGRNDPTLLSQIAVYEAKIGETAEADKQIRAAFRLAPKDAEVLFRAAIVHELGNRRGVALADLEAAVSRGYSLNVIEGEPELASLRTDPSYRAVAAHAVQTGENK